MSAYLKFAPWYTVFSVFVFWALRLYNSVWRFASYSELLRICLSTVITFLFQIIGITFVIQRMPMSYYLFGTIIQFCLITGIRFSYRFILLERTRKQKEEEGPLHHIMLIGAGQAGQIILRDVERAKEPKGKVCCIIDDNPNKWGRYMESVPIVGGRDDILASAKKYKIDQILLAIPSASAAERRDILNICKESKCEMKILPGVYQFVTGEVSLSKMKDVAVEDLLGREPIKVNMDEIFRYISGKTILVTGGGGSIGSELCRQIAAHAPKRLVIFDVYENNAYDIQMELRRRYPQLDLVTLIGSVRDERRVRYVFDTYRPDVVCHAAAHKHVPLMEDSPAEAIKNNIFGTYNVAKAAGDFDTGLFILISTDKAVNPTNVMGASKRMCEMVVQSMNGQHHTKYIAVRFGNVLGSNGSVIPLFRKQIAEGGPVTVTDKRVTRFFMTIPEAVSLILQAGAYAEGGEVFVLDMGEPVRIDDMARKMIRLSGFEPDVDIEIKYIGLRPGEKLYEELLLKSEGLQKTDNKLIYIGHQVIYTPQEIEEKLETLRGVLYASNAEVRDCMLGIIKEPADRMYEPIPGAVNPADTIEV